MNYKTKQRIVRMLKDMDLFNMSDTEVVDKGEYISITIKDLYNEELYKMQYHYKTDCLLMAYVIGPTYVADNVYESTRKTITKAKEVREFTSMDKDIIQAVEDIRKTYGLWGDQLTEYCFYVLEEKHGKQIALEIMEKVIDTFKGE